MPALMAKPTPDAAAPIPTAGLPRGAWLALAAALLGWMFDGAEMAVFSMVGGPGRNAPTGGGGGYDGGFWPSHSQSQSCARCHQMRQSRTGEANH